MLDRPVARVELPMGEGWIDRSSSVVKEESWRLPTPHVKLEYDERVFYPRPTAPVRLVAVWLNDQPHDVHFEVDEGTSDATLHEDVAALLSDLKSWLGYTPCSPQF